MHLWNMRMALWSKLILLVVALGNMEVCAAQAGATGTADLNAILPCWADLEAHGHATCATCIAKAERQWPRPNDGQRGELLALKGALAYANGDPARAGSLLHEALPLFLQEGRPWPVGVRIYRTLGHIAYEEGDHHKAIGYYNSMLALCQQQAPDGALDLGRAHYNIGNCFWGMDQRDSCKAHYAEALRFWKEGDQTGVPVIGYIHEVLGTYAWDEGDERTALEEFNIAAAHQLKNASGTDRADELAGTARAASLSDRPEEALRLYQQALDLRTLSYGAGHPYTACMHSDIARMLARIGRHADALSRAQQAIALFVPAFKPTDDLSNPASVDSATSHRLLFDALLLKFGLLASDSANARARVSANEVIDLALRTIERLRTGVEADASKLFWSAHVRDFLEAALAHVHRQFDANDTLAVRRALTIMELGRNALLAEAMRSLDAGTNGGLPDSLASAERTLKQHIAEMQRYILLEEKKCERMDADKVGLWKKAVAAGEADLDRLVSRIAKDFPTWHRLKYAITDIDPRALAARFGHERSLLSMFLGKEALYLLLFDDRGARLVKEERVSDITNAANELRGALRDRASSLADPQGAFERFVNSASVLHHLVFAPLVPAPYPRLTIVPDGVFHYVPFDVLLVEKPTGSTRDYQKLHYLINDLIIHVEPMLRTPPDSRRGGRIALDYLGVAPSYSVDNDRHLVPLGANIAEVEAAHGMLGGAMLLGDQADEGTFKRMAGQAAVLHLAMHTMMDEADPLRTAFAFGRSDSTEDGSLNMVELAGMDLNARLALLSACNTGAGPMLHGEGIMSMARAFQYTGCPAVVMNLWTSDDDASSSIIASLCERIKDGAPTDEALRQAKLDYLRKSDPAKAHPYYWATLLLVGDERAVDLGGPWYQSPWLLAIPALFAVVISLLVRKRFQQSA